MCDTDGDHFVEVCGIEAGGDHVHTAVFGSHNRRTFVHEFEQDASATVPTKRHVVDTHQKRKTHCDRQTNRQTHSQQHNSRHAATNRQTLAPTNKANLLFNSTTHTHTRFNGPLSGTTRVSWYQKGKTNLDFTGARD